MDLTQEQIKKLSKNLSKIETTEPKLVDDLNGILKYVELLNEVDTTGVPQTVSVVESENILRDDEEKAKSVTPQELLACSKQKVVANQIAISNIMK
ncbi:aspartyl/glutamyl-tRNA amidotransferase subunit C [Candidatus Gracilibacteria bacterium]|nr:aspartyl/glutamyl-tRNA amidotransferase subunit C [Candidatus Gracilibacteria bacterium]MBF0913915.1 aspartyl/glutamyl-tRNA amidotransferase subunit C [Candidatus Gracilibacteria bacterium]RKW22777.1 MAG: aspartyl/glutamyl-tRNA amidotransferase subunit C [Candidatus Gracilibacteria bacterium]